MYRVTTPVAPVARPSQSAPARPGRSPRSRRYRSLLAALGLALSVAPTVAAADEGLCDLTGPWQKTYDYAENGALGGYTRTNEFEFEFDGQTQVGRYIGATAGNTSVFTADCVSRGASANVSITQTHGGYTAVIDGVREGDVITGTWSDVRGNRGDIVITPYVTPACDLGGVWTKTYDLADDGRMAGRVITNAFEFEPDGWDFVGHYIGATASNPSVFTTACVEQGGETHVTIWQAHGAYWSVIEGTRVGDRVTGVWYDVRGNRGDIYVERD